MAPNSIILSVLFLLLLSISPSLESDDVMRFAKNRLKAFGYLSGDYTSTDDDYDEALASARSVPASAENTTLQYAFYPGNPKWPKHMRRLKYVFTTSKPIPSKNVSEAISRAFLSWSAVTELTFKEVKGIFSTPQIKIGFYRREHGCPKPFDGRGGSYAHAFAPTNGTLHFDKDEDWGTVEAPNILDLESVALHEIGHLLGLDHSGRRSAVMYRTFRYGQIKRELDQDDIDGIRALYVD